MTATSESRSPSVDPTLEEVVETIDRHGNERTSLMHVLRDIQERHRCVSPGAQSLVAEVMGIPRVEVEGFVSFYSFLSEEPWGDIVIRVCDDVPDRMRGFERVLSAFREAVGVEVGRTSADGITLTTTASIGLSDQAPAALVNDVPVTELSTDKVHRIVEALRSHRDPKKLVTLLGDGNNAHPLVRSMVKNNLMHPGPLIFSPVSRGQAIRRATRVSPAEVIRQVKAARLRGRGGAGFPTGMKWEFTRASLGERKFVICNADEGEPGTFKDRVILTERPDRVFSGMTVAGYAIGAQEGIVYLRAEYQYLRAYLEAVLAQRRSDGLLGRDIVGRPGFHFDIRIQMGAGAYVCGEETALIRSCEGRAGEPLNRPPFPAEHGFLGCPTSVNNVETYCCIAKILEEGAAAFNEYGTPESAGTKVLSISGDCLKPGIYEVAFGITLHTMLEMCGAEDARAVQVGGPSGSLVGPTDFHRRICFNDLPTGGSMIVFGPDRDLLSVVYAFAEFFADESCGYCTPCRVGTQLILRYLERLRAGRAEASDIEELRRTARTMKTTSRCGLGSTACNPVLTSMERFPELYAPVDDHPDAYRRSFDLARAVAEAERLSGRTSRGEHVEQGYHA